MTAIDTTKDQSTNTALRARLIAAIQPYSEAELERLNTISFAKTEGLYRLKFTDGNRPTNNTGEYRNPATGTVLKYVHIYDGYVDGLLTPAIHSDGQKEYYLNGVPQDSPTGEPAVTRYSTRTVNGEEQIWQEIENWDAGRLISKRTERYPAEPQIV